MTAEDRMSRALKVGLVLAVAIAAEVVWIICAEAQEHRGHEFRHDNLDEFYSCVGIEGYATPPPPPIPSNKVTNSMDAIAVANHGCPTKSRPLKKRRTATRTAKRTYPVPH